VGAIGDTQKALSSARRVAISDKMMSQLKSITSASLMRTEVGGDALALSGTGLSVAMRKVAVGDIAGSHIGYQSITESWGFEMSSSFGLEAPEEAIVMIQAVRSSSAYNSASAKATSDILSLLTWSLNGEQLYASAGSIDMTSRLNTNTHSPSCASWDGSTWQNVHQAMLTHNRASNSAVICNVSELGSFAIIETCDPMITCSGNGDCNAQGACHCHPGWTGAQCNLQYCDNVLFPCHNGGTCACAAEMKDCLADCLATGCSEQTCEEKCPSVGYISEQQWHMFQSNMTAYVEAPSPSPSRALEPYHNTYKGICMDDNGPLDYSRFVTITNNAMSEAHEAFSCISPYCISNRGDSDKQCDQNCMPTELSGISAIYAQSLATMWSSMDTAQRALLLQFLDPPKQYIGQSRAIALSAMLLAMSPEERTGALSEWSALDPQAAKGQLEASCTLLYAPCLESGFSLALSETLEYMGEMSGYSPLTCPVVSALKQTMCACPAGFSGRHCEVAIEVTTVCSVGRNSPAALFIGILLTLAALIFTRS